jgi:nucleoside-diphosphate-sugar epimerase
LAQQIIQLAQSNSQIIFKPHPGPEVQVRVPSIEKANKILNYFPKISLEEGLKQTIAWYKQHSVFSQSH